MASGKGGVGKSTVTANLAVTLSKMGFKVGVLDADIYGPSMPIMFDVEAERPLAVNVNGKSKMKPIENYGVKMLSIGFFTQPNQAVVWRGPMAAKALNQMIFDAHWDELDFLLLDLPPGTGDIHLSIMQSLPITGAVVVSTPQNVALADAKKGVAMFQQDSINVPVLGIVENMAYFTPEELPENKYFIFAGCFLGAYISDLIAFSIGWDAGNYALNSEKESIVFYMNMRGFIKSQQGKDKIKDIKFHPDQLSRLQSTLTIKNGKTASRISHKIVVHSLYYNMQKSLLI